jgi:biopolymer transport protein ExbB
MFQNTLFLQTTELQQAAAAESQSIIELLLEGSMFGVIIIILLVIMSFIALFIFIERYLTIKRASEIDDNFMNNIRSHVQTGHIQAARSLCANTDSPIARMVEKGLMRIGKPLDDIEHAIENVGRLEIYKMEKNVNILAIIAGVSPMFGFLGTIAGMIQTFASLSTANNLSIGVIAGGIYVKMFTSGIGLIVGIMAFIFYNYLNTLIDRVVNQMENSTFTFIDLLQEPTS